MSKNSLLGKAMLSTTLLASGGAGSVFTLLLNWNSETKHTKLNKEINKVKQEGSRVTKLAGIRLTYMGELEKRQECFEAEAKKAKEQGSVFNAYELKLDACAEPQTKLE